MPLIEENTINFLEKFEGKGLTFNSKQLDADNDRVFYIDRSLFEVFGYGEFLHLACNDHLDINGKEECQCVKKIKKYISLWDGNSGIEFIENDRCSPIIETNENREAHKKRPYWPNSQV